MLHNAFQNWWSFGSQFWLSQSQVLLPCWNSSPRLDKMAGTRVSQMFSPVALILRKPYTEDASLAVTVWKWKSIELNLRILTTVIIGLRFCHVLQKLSRELQRSFITFQIPITLRINSCYKPQVTLFSIKSYIAPYYSDTLHSDNLWSFFTMVITLETIDPM